MRYPPSSTEQPATTFETCDTCQAPLDAGQRYCVTCGAKRANADDPALRYLAESHRKARAAEQPPGGAAEPRHSGVRTALLLALLPVVACVGVLVGRGASNGDEGLAEALKAQKAPIVNVGAAAGPGTAATNTPVANTAIASTFGLSKGFAIRLQKVPVAGATSASVQASVRALQAKGAGKVAVLSAKDYVLTPSSGSAYTLVSGAYAKKPAAVSALKALKAKFPDAVVVAVKPKVGGAEDADGEVIAKTKNGSARKLEGSKVTPAQIEESRKALDKIVNSKGQTYVEQQQGLPDQIVIP